MISSEIPKRPWATIGIDLFEFEGKTYLVVQDYYSKYPELARLERTRAKDVIHRIKDIFARHGIPEIVRSDNGSQFDCLEFRQFAKMFNFQWIPSSPYNSQSNGLAESGVKTCKKILRKCEDPFLGLLSYRNSPLVGGYSPSQLLFGRSLRDNLPTLEANLEPKFINHNDYFCKMQEQKKKQKINFDRSHNARQLSSLKPDQLVWIVDKKMYGRVLNKVGQRRFVIRTENESTIRRNRRFLREMPSTSDGVTGCHVEPPVTAQLAEQPNQPRRSARESRKPVHLKDYICE